MTAAVADRIRFRFAALTVAWFVLALFLPTVDKLVRIDPAPKVDELRAYAGFPHAWLLRGGDVRGWTTQFETWFNDHFGFRDSLLRSAAWLRTIVFRSAGREEVVLGDDDWLFYGGLPQGNCRGLDPWTECELERWRFGIEGWNDYCALLGVKLLVALIPDKQEIYPERLPPRERLVGEATRTEQLVRHMRASGSPVDLLDLREPLRAARAGGDVFLKADTHWNRRGARAAYDALIERIARRFPEVVAVPESETRFAPFPDGVGDLARMLCLESLSNDVPGSLVPLQRKSRAGAYPLLPEDRARFKRPGTHFAETGDASLPRVLIFRDSFTTPLEPLIPESFERCVFVSVVKPGLSVPFEPDIVLRERPDLVVVLSVDRYLMGPVPEQVARIGGAFDDAACTARFRVASTDSVTNGFAGITAANPPGTFAVGTVASLHAEKDDPRFVVPCLSDASGKRIRVDVAIEVPVASVLEVFARTAGAENFDGDHRQTVATRKGWNLVRVYLPAAQGVEALRIDPGLGAGDYHVARVEVAVED